MIALLLLAVFASAEAVSRSADAPWLLRVVARTIAIAMIAYAAWFGMLFTGVVRLDWLTHWLGTPKLQRPWDLIAMFGPAVVAGMAYFLFAISRPRGRSEP